MDWCGRDLFAGRSLFSATRLLLSNGEKKPAKAGSYIFGGERGINSKRSCVLNPLGFAGKPLVSSCSVATCRTLYSDSHPSYPSKYKKTAYWRFFCIWRRERDSNPRYAINVYTLSRRAPSATQPSLQIWYQGFP